MLNPMSEITHNLAEEYGLSAEKLGQNAKRTRWIGIASIVIGVLAILLPSIFTIGFEIIFGGLLLAGGLLQIMNALSYHGTKDWGFQLVAGMSLAILGGLMLLNPFAGAATLTAILAAVFFVNGFIRVIHGFQMRGMWGNGFGILNGIFGILISVMIFATWPVSSLWLIGILIGIDFLLVGFWLISIASTCDEALNH